MTALDIQRVLPRYNRPCSVLERREQKIYETIYLYEISMKEEPNNLELEKQFSNSINNKFTKKDLFRLAHSWSLLKPAYEVNSIIEITLKG